MNGTRKWTIDDSSLFLYAEDTVHMIPFKIITPLYMCHLIWLYPRGEGGGLFSSSQERSLFLFWYSVASRHECSLGSSLTQC